MVKLHIKNASTSTLVAGSGECQIIDGSTFWNCDRREMSVTEFADRAGISRQAVVKMISGGRLQASMVGEQYIIPQEALVRYLRTS